MSKSIARFLLAALITLTLPAAAGAQFRIKDDATGGDCKAQIGTWDVLTKTCTFTGNVAGTISVDANDITLEGDGHTLKPALGGPAIVGLTIAGRTGVTVRKLSVERFSQNILIRGGSGNEIQKCTVRASTVRLRGAIFLERTRSNTVAGNTAIGNLGFGIELLDAHGNTVRGNVLHDNGHAGIYMIASSHNFVAGNEIQAAGHLQTGGIKLRFSDENLFWSNLIGPHRWLGMSLNRSDRNDIRFNTIWQNGFGGAGLGGSSNTTIVCNDFTTNRGIGVSIAAMAGAAGGNEVFWNNFYAVDSASDAGGAPNVFNKPAPTGGNYWQVNAPACVDANLDGLCDAPYAFPGNQDNLPHLRPVPWRLFPLACFVGEESSPIEDLEAVEQFQAALDMKDLALLSRVVTNDAVLVAADGSTSNGRPAVLAFWEKRFAQVEGFELVSSAASSNDRRSAIVKGTLYEHTGKERAAFTLVMMMEGDAAGAWRVSRLMLYSEK
jgi:parallel beta-helix repeat protein